MLKLIQRIAREISAFDAADRCALARSRAWFAEAARVERAYARYETPTWMRRRAGAKLRALPRG